METLFIPNENDFKKWIKEAVQEYFQNALPGRAENNEDAAIFLNRKEVAKLLQISLVTLTDWMKRGLPYHKQRGRVYFVKSDVLQFIKRSSLTKARFRSGFDS